MKKSTQMILNYFPMIEDHINDVDSVVLRDKTLSDLDNPEYTFLCLVWFFENPNKENFDLGILYKNLDDYWLSKALECIYVFFTKDTYLIKKPTFSIISDKDTLYNQADFVKYLDQYKSLHGRNFSRAMLNTYVKRGIVPQPDVVIGNNKYWNEESCEEYAKTLSESEDELFYDHEPKFEITEKRLYEDVTLNDDDFFFVVNSGSSYRTFELMRGILSNLKLHKIVHYRFFKKWQTVFHVGNEKILFRDGFSSGYRGGGSNNLVLVIMMGLEDSTVYDQDQLDDVLFNKKYDCSIITIDIL